MPGDESAEPEIAEAGAEADQRADTRTRPSLTRRETWLASGDEAAMPTTLGRYQLKGILGRGGMGVVMAAYDTDLDRPVAIKLLHPWMWSDRSLAAARIEREAQAMAKLSHPNVVTVYEVVRSGPRPFIAMELVDGVTLRAWRKATARPWRTALRLLIAAGRGLAAAHEVGLVHRDFKPENVLIGADLRPRVSDFGLVASLASEPPPEGPGEGDDDGPGTPSYMAPEQWDGRDVDHRADQFAFAVVCWEILWGSRPFVGTTHAELRQHIEGGQPVPVAERAGVPRRVESILRRALSPSREARWPDLGALLEQLERQVRDRRALTALALTSVVAVGLAGTLLLRAPAGVEESPCRAAAASLDAIWNPQRSRAVQAAFERHPGAFAFESWQAAERGLDRWVLEHRNLRIETCELGLGAAEGVAAVSAARMTCLDRRLTELDALLGVLAQPDATVVQYARAAVDGLPRSSGCRGFSAADLAAQPGLAASPSDVAQLQAQLARAAALRAVGKPRDAVAIAEPAARRADALGSPLLVASAQLELGLGYQAIQSNAAGEQAHLRAVWNADASQDDRARFDATLGLAIAATDRSAYDEASRLLESARMIARRLPDDSQREAALANQVAMLAFWRGDFVACVERSKDAIALIDRTLGTQTVMGGRLRVNLARCLGNLGRLPEIGAPLNQALAVVDATTGRRHPLAAEALSQLATVARAEDRHEDALSLLKEAMEIRRDIFGPDNVEMAKLHNNLGNVLSDLGRPDEARIEIERAVAIWLGAWGPDSPAVATGLGNLGGIAMDRADFVAAEEYFRRALASRRKNRPPGHFDTSKALVNLARSLLAQRDRSCLPLLEEAVAAFGAMTDVDAGQFALARFHLGRALLELGGDRQRGRALIEDACVGHEAVSDGADDAKECRAYLAGLRRR